MAYADRQQAQQHFSVLWPVSLLVQSTCVGCHMSSSFQNSRSAMPIPTKVTYFCRICLVQSWRGVAQLGNVCKFQGQAQQKFSIYSRKVCDMSCSFQNLCSAELMTDILIHRSIQEHLHTTRTYLDWSSRVTVFLCVLCVCGCSYGLPHVFCRVAGKQGSAVVSLLQQPQQFQSSAPCLCILRIVSCVFTT